MVSSFKKIADEKLQPDSFEFNKENKKKALEVMKNYPKNYLESSIMPLLSLAQEQFGGWIPKKALEHNDIVIGPCYDGGYYLIGMKSFNNKIFKNISWSKKQVFKQTLSKVLENSVYYLEIKNDIDNKESLRAHTSLYELYKKTLS